MYGQRRELARKVPNVVVVSTVDLSSLLVDGAKFIGPIRRGFHRGHIALELWHRRGCSHRAAECHHIYGIILESPNSHHADYEW